MLRRGDLAEGLSGFFFSFFQYFLLLLHFNSLVCREGVRYKYQPNSYFSSCRYHIEPLIFSNKTFIILPPLPDGTHASIHTWPRPLAGRRQAGARGKEAASVARCPRVLILASVIYESVITGSAHKTLGHRRCGPPSKTSTINCGRPHVYER